MQTDILLKQVTAALADLRTAMDKFEKHPNMHYAEQLHNCLNKANKLVAAYTVLKEQKEVSPELDLHLKIMSADAPKPEPIVEKKPEPVVEKAPETKVEEPVREELKPEVKPEIKPEIIPVVEEKKMIVPEPVVHPEKEKAPEPVHTLTPPVTTPVHKEVPKLTVNINDKFRLINELFASNANEYHIAIEQLNSVASKEEADTYLKGLKSIYHWDEENEMVKRLMSMNQKRFS
jgi:hypothetical protein